jgi:DGQHR domain-containing protein
MRELRVPALQLAQGPTREIYSFGVDGKLLHRFAAVSRVGRDDDAAIRGYQRPEVLSHINAIRAYIESETPMIPNGIVVAFDSRVRFEPVRTARKVKDIGLRQGSLIIPLDEEERPGWIVDGQQRAAAIRDARVDRFPIFINAFITEEVAEQRAQFILVNSTKPLPKGLIHELLPATEAPLPPALHKRRLPALLMERLNYDTDSPLQGRIRTPTSTTGTIKDNSILKVLENSISDGALYPYRFTDHGHPDTDGMLRLLKNFWTAVERVFADAWEKPPRQSRLTHGLGILSLGFLMDAIGERFEGREPTVGEFEADLELIEPMCAWTSGAWQLGPYQRRWNDVQNTPRDVQVIADHLLSAYRRALKRRERGTQTRVHEASA